MKKLISSLFAVVLSVVVLSSCGGGVPDVSSIVDKYNNGEELTEADYSTLLDYMEEAMSELLPIAQEAQEAAENEDMAKVMEIGKEAEAIVKNYEHADAVGNILRSADLDEANAERLNELMEKAMDIAM